MLLSEGLVGFQMSGELMLQRDSAPLCKNVNTHSLVCCRPLILKLGSLCMELVLPQCVLVILHCVYIGWLECK